MGYYNLNDGQVKMILDTVKIRGDRAVDDLKIDLQYQYSKITADQSKYRLAAMNKLSKIDSKAVNNEELVMDDDALVSSSNTGAYVQCWLWVDNDVKPKRTRKKATI
jgi:hypothetical protein